MCWNKHGEEGLNELEAGCLNEGEVRHHATDHDEDLDDSGLSMMKTLMLKKTNAQR
jgi:hypothetical protein